MNPKVDEFLAKSTKWQTELTELRHVLLGCGLTEEVKWRNPCYTYHQGNVVLIHAFKEYCALLFFKGALLTDAHGLLIQQSDNVQAARQIRFTSLRQIVELAPVLKAYVYEALEVEKSGLKVILKKTTEYPVPSEFQIKLDEMPALKTAFESLTPGRQRAYILHFSQPKQTKTRESRIDKYLPKILEGKGLDD